MHFISVLYYIILTSRHFLPPCTIQDLQKFYSILFQEPVPKTFNALQFSSEVSFYLQAWANVRLCGSILLTPTSRS